MEAFLALSSARRADVLRRAAGELGLAESAIEKDLWVCWVLRALFQSTNGAHLTFKGGTSLSKGWGLIERFSEDIDLVLDRERIGFSGAAAPEAAASRREQERRAAAVRQACQRHVQTSVMPSLTASVEAGLSGEHGASVAIDPGDPDQQTILLTYGSVLAASGYVSPVVKIELGARSDPEPSREPDIAPYLARVGGMLGRSATFRVRAVAPERTFWEKVSLLHEASYKAGAPKGRLARHYYDLWCLDQRGIAASAFATPELFRREAKHRSMYFRGTAEGQRTLVLGQIRLVPSTERLPLWRRDYERMQDMFFDTPPTFDAIMIAAADLERRINALGTGEPDRHDPPN